MLLVEVYYLKTQLKDGIIHREGNIIIPEVQSNFTIWSSPLQEKQMDAKALQQAH